jgi:predicted permease
MRRLVEQGAHELEERLCAGGFGQERREAGRDRRVPRPLIGIRRQRNRRHGASGGPLPDLADERDAVLHRHAEVGDDERRRMALELRPRVLGRCHRRHLRALALQRRGHHLPRRLVIVDDQNRAAVEAYVRGRRGRRGTWSRFDGRQPDLEARAVARTGALRGHHAVVQLGQVLHDRQAEPQPSMRPRRGTVVLILALGIGVNSVVFSFFNGLLFRANVSHDPASFVRLYAQRSGTSRPEPQGGVPTMMTLEEWDAIRTQNGTLSAVTASKWATFVVSEGVVANLRGLFVSCNFLAIHLPTTLLGRTLEESDCAAAGSAPVAVLSERAWSAFFDRDPGIIGRTVTVNNHPLNVIGVVPDHAVGDPEVRMIFVPHTMYALLQGPDDFFRATPDRYAWLNLSGRLAPGKSVDDVQVEVNAIVNRLDRLHPGRTTDVLVTDGALIREPGRARTIVGLVLAATTLMLLLVCTNVTTLLLSRSEARRREMAIRMALGASRARLLTQLGIEGTVPALAAAGLSLGLAFYVPNHLAQMLAGFPLGISLAPDLRVLAYTLVVALVAGSVAALSPALPSLRLSASDGFHVDPRTDLSPRWHGNRREHLISQQLAASLALMVALGLVWHAQNRLKTPNLPYDTNRILVTNFDLSRLRYSPVMAAGLYRELFTRLESLPAVQMLAVSTQPPFHGGLPPQITVASDDGGTWATSVRTVSPGYFRLLGVRVIQGRVFSEEEAQSAANPLPVVVSESLMRALSGRADASGQRVRLPDDTCAQIVGVVANTSTVRVGEVDGPVLYHPISAAGRWSRAPTTPRLSVLVGSTGDPRPIAQALRAHAQALDPQLIVVPETVAETISREAERYTTVVTLTAVLAGVAFLLSLVGIYGVTAFIVVQRRKEIGIRTALGARPEEVVRLFMWSLRRPVIVGVVAGTLLAVLGAWWLQYARLLPATEAGNNPWIYGAALVWLVSTAGIATAFPAWRAALATPWTVLRNE